jgi:hypothetical protein
MRFFITAMLSPKRKVIIAMGRFGDGEPVCR